MVGEEGTVERSALLLQYSYGDFYARIAQLLYALAVYLIKIVAAANDHSRYMLAHDEVGARRCLPIVGTRLEAHIHGGFA